ncbi:Gamma-butyrobetaine dioxygenase [Myxococcaceae bacterium]|jgi:ATP-binding protein involved in chromosome partitioning|nr:Gamma-butyrobetaine dioxygenase [Myxococcaceae bacterium]
MADPSSITPTAIRQEGPRALCIVWADGHRSVYDVRALRLACACARCVDEWTGEGRLDETKVPEDVRPIELHPVGRYAIQIEWSDGHASGIYPFRRLRELG